MLVKRSSLAWLGLYNSLLNLRTWIMIYQTVKSMHLIFIKKRGLFSKHIERFSSSMIVFSFDILYLVFLLPQSFISLFLTYNFFWAPYNGDSSMSSSSMSSQRTYRYGEFTRVQYNGLFASLYFPINLSLFGNWSHLQLVI